MRRNTGFIVVNARVLHGWIGFAGESASLAIYGRIVDGFSGRRSVIVRCHPPIDRVG